MNSVGKTTAAGGVGAALVGILTWGLSLKGITIPSDVAADLVVVFAAVAHYAASLLVKEGVPVPAPNTQAPSAQ